MVGIVVSQDIVDQDTPDPERGSGVAIGVAAGSIGGTVGAVTAHAEYGGVGNAVNAHGRGQGKLLIAAALAFSGELNDGFTASQEGQLFAAAGMGLQNGGQEAAGFLCLAAQLICQQDGLVTGCGRLPLRRRTAPGQSR